MAAPCLLLGSQRGGKRRQTLPDAHGRRELWLFGLSRATSYLRAHLSSASSCIFCWDSALEAAGWFSDFP